MSVVRRAGLVGLALCAVLWPAAAAAPPALAAPRAHSLYSGPGPRPGPPLLYSSAARAPQLTNARPWKAAPILVSGATAYRQGEFLYQDFLYDDHGPHVVADPNDPQSSGAGDLFSMPNGTYTYPTGPGYLGNAADLVELRVKPLARATAFRVTLNTLANPSLIAFSIAIGGTPGHLVAFPDGANVRAPAGLFLTVHPRGSRMVGELVRAGGGAIRGPAPRVRVDRRRRQIEVDVPHRDWNPGRRSVRLAMGVGLWSSATGRYLLPQAAADATHPGGAGTGAHPAAFFNVAFRTAEPFPSVTGGASALTDAAWWRDQAQGAALARGDISPFFAQVRFAKLAHKRRDDSQIPHSGAIDRILGSHYEPAQGVEFSHQCGLQGSSNPASCTPEYRGRLQPYAIYIPRGAPGPRGYGLTLLLHSLSANYNQFVGSRNQQQFGERTPSSIAITPEARGPDQFYEGYGSADVFEVWADVARRYRLDPAYTDITGYSMGGIGTFKLGEQFPDLFARAQPTVGNETDNDLVASLRNLPVLMWNNSADELVNPALYAPTASRLASLGYRYELDAFQPCANPKCSPLFPNHLELAVNDQFAPAAAFLGSATVDPNPAHVTYVVDPAREHPELGLAADHAYWISGLALRSATQKGASGIPEGQIDAVSHGFGTGDPPVSGLELGLSRLLGGNLGPLAYTSFSKRWGATPAGSRSDELDITATNIGAASINVSRAKVDCHALVKIKSDGPLAVTLSGCGRTVHAG